jgi:hypothetical protein
MPVTDPLCHAATAIVERSAADAFAFLSDPTTHGGWAIGSFAATEQPNGLMMGRSLIDGGETWVKIEPHPDLMIIDYSVGTPDKLLPRISTRVIPGPVLALGPDQCMVTMTAWRPADMSDARWARVCVTHDAEILMIAGQIERA